MKKRRKKKDSMSGKKLKQFDMHTGSTKLTKKGKMGGKRHRKFARKLKRKL